MKQITLFLLFIVFSNSISAQLRNALRDEAGRHVIGRGFVVVTNDSYFTSDDYLRMVRLGANYQVVRLELGKLSNFRGARVDADYLLKLDSLVQLGKDVGIKTVFKMTMYGLDDFTWEKFWVNDNNMHKTYMDAWRLIWNRYKNENAVTAYDLINEPRKHTMDVSYKDLTSKYLFPLYRQLIDESQKINADKYCMIQTIFMNKGDKVDGSQYAQIAGSLGRGNITFSPHIYQWEKELLKPIILRFENQSKVLDAPVFIGEWGVPTYATTDSLIQGELGQLNYMDLYIRTAQLFDSLGFNTIKAWFSGNPKMQNFLPHGRSTWAIFSDKNAVGNVERKYITDVIARPFPQTIAGDLNSFKYDFATRSLDVFVTSDNSKGASQVFIGANRHYPDGFTIIIDSSLVLHYDPIKNAGLEVSKQDGIGSSTDFTWDEQKQQLHILKWPKDKVDVHLRVIPGINSFSGISK